MKTTVRQISPTAAGYPLHVKIQQRLSPHETRPVPTVIKLASVTAYGILLSRWASMLRISCGTLHFHAGRHAK